MKKIYKLMLLLYITCSYATFANQSEVEEINRVSYANEGKKQKKGNKNLEPLDKEVAKTKIGELQGLSDFQKNHFINKLEDGSKSKNQKLLNKATNLNEKKKNLVTLKKKLKNLNPGKAEELNKEHSEDKINNIKKVDELKNIIEKYNTEIKKAKASNQTEQPSTESQTTEKEKTKEESGTPKKPKNETKPEEKGNTEESKSEDKANKKKEELAKYREEAIKEIDSLSNLSNQQKAIYKKRINKKTTKNIKKKLLVNAKDVNAMMGEIKDKIEKLRTEGKYEGEVEKIHNRIKDSTFKRGIKDFLSFLNTNKKTDNLIFLSKEEVLIKINGYEHLTSDQRKNLSEKLEHAKFPTNILKKAQNLNKFMSKLNYYDQVSENMKNHAEYEELKTKYLNIKQSIEIKKIKDLLKIYNKKIGKVENLDKYEDLARKFEYLDMSHRDDYEIEGMYINFDLGGYLNKKLKNKKDDVIIKEFDFGYNHKVSDKFTVGGFAKYDQEFIHNMMIGTLMKYNITEGNSISGFGRYRFSFDEKDHTNHSIDLNFDYGYKYKKKNLEVSPQVSMYITGQTGFDMEKIYDKKPLSYSKKKKVSLKPSLGFDAILSTKIKYYINDDGLFIYAKPRFRGGYNDKVLEQIGLKANKKIVKNSYFSYGLDFGAGYTQEKHGMSVNLKVNANEKNEVKLTSGIGIYHSF